MENTTRSSEKRIVEKLSFGAKTAKRVGWEAFEFAIESPHLVRVTNASYGIEKDDHSYLVGVEECDGLPVPAECGCKADQYRDDYDCKHKVALATVAGPVVLNAAVESDNGTAALSGRDSASVTTVADKLQTDGGTPPAGTDPEACQNGNVHCEGPASEILPCFDCFESTEVQ